MVMLLYLPPAVLVNLNISYTNWYLNWLGGFLEIKGLSSSWTLLICLTTLRHSLLWWPHISYINKFLLYLKYIWHQNDTLGLNYGLFVYRKMVMSIIMWHGRFCEILQGRHICFIASRVTANSTVFSSLFRRTLKKTWKLRITGPFMRRIRSWPVNSLRTGLIMRKTSPWHDVLVNRFHFTKFSTYLKTSSISRIK